MRKCIAGLRLVAVLIFSTRVFAQNLTVSGRVLDEHGKPVIGAAFHLVHEKFRLEAGTDAYGYFSVQVRVAGEYEITVEAPAFHPLSQPLTLAPGTNDVEIQLSPLIARTDTVIVTADANTMEILRPDPAEKVFVHEDLLDANPGRPGAPVSLPGYPIETASSGIKAPQYFAPGVAGDHGEPIAQYVAVGSYLVPNNLSANAHGNGYADPNIFIPQILETAEVDGGAFNVLQGNHSVNLAAIYRLRSRVHPFLTFTGDYRDMNLVAGLSPAGKSFVAMEASYGNGFLKRLEHRQQYKLNGQRIFRLANHELTGTAIGYYGFSYLPGLVPIFARNADDVNTPNVEDTIDPRQKDQTHTMLVALNDAWSFAEGQQLQTSGFFRTYNLALYSNFGQGLIRQSEFRTVTGASANYVNDFTKELSLLAGLDYDRDAPRRDNLDHYNFYIPGDFTYGPFTKVASNNVIVSPLTTYGALAGALGHFRYYAGWRRDQIDIDNEDLIHPENSSQKWVGVNSPKATVSFVPKESSLLPLVSASYGEAFFVVDPRIGIGTTAGTSVATAHSYQLVTSRTFAKTDLRVTLGHVTTRQQLAKIDADTGLQEDQGPGRLNFLSAAVQHTFNRGSILATFSKADARDVDSGEPTPEAPRTIVDLLGSAPSLPFRLQARGEFEYIGRKPLGMGCEPDPLAQCVGTSVREFRGAVVRPFLNDRLEVGANLLIAKGFTGQTTENFYPSQIPQVVGVRIPSYASINVTYRFSPN